MKDRFERERHAATLRLMRRLGHDLAAPLSAAAIHLEVATRQIARPHGAGPSESLATVQRSLASATALLHVLREVAESEWGEAEEFAVTEAVRSGARLSASGPDGRVPVVLPEPAARPTLHGCRSRLETAVGAITDLAVDACRGGVVTWSVGDPAGTPSLVCSFSGELRARNPDLLFGPSVPALFLARWAVESHGGALEAELAGGEVRIVSRFVTG